jgi:hypothetical protein
MKFPVNFPVSREFGTAFDHTVSRRRSSDSASHANWMEFTTGAAIRERMNRAVQKSPVTVNRLVADSASRRSKQKNEASRKRITQHATYEI